LRGKWHGRLSAAENVFAQTGPQARPLATSDQEVFMWKSLIGLVWGGAVSLALLSTPARATFIAYAPPEPPNLDKLFLVASDNQPNFSGDVGGQASGCCG
jgi:hypothetical protein